MEWYDYGYRNYDPQIGRFPQLDPLTDDFPALTPYQYASNEPIANIDLDGLEGVGAVGGAASSVRDFSYGYQAVNDATTLWKPVVQAVKATSTASNALHGLTLAENLTSLGLHGVQIAGNAINKSTTTHQIGSAVSANAGMGLNKSMKRDAAIMTGVEQNTSSQSGPIQTNFSPHISLKSLLKGA